MIDELDIYDLPVSAIRAFARAVRNYRRVSRVISRNDVISISLSKKAQRIRFTYKWISVDIKPKSPITVSGMWSLVGDNCINNFISFICMISKDSSLYIDFGDDYVNMHSISLEFRGEVVMYAIVDMYNDEEENDIEEELVESIQKFI